MIQTAGRLKFLVMMCGALEHAEHDRADKSDCDIRGNNAQSADESHGNAPLVHVAARYNAETSKAFRPEKVSAAVDPSRLHRLVRRQRG